MRPFTITKKILRLSSLSLCILAPITLGGCLLQREMHINVMGKLAWQMYQENEETLGPPAMNRELNVYELGKEDFVSLPSAAVQCPQGKQTNP